MYALTICFGPVGTSWRLLYKTKEQATHAFNNGTIGDCFEVTDDFGQVCRVEEKNIHGRMLEDLDESKIGNVEMALHGARTQASAQRQAEADPALRTARMAQSPAMLNPMGNGRWPS